MITTTNMTTFTNIDKSTAKGFIRLETTSTWSLLLLESGDKLTLEVESNDAFQEKTDVNNASFSNPSRNDTTFTNINLS